MCKIMLYFWLIQYFSVEIQNTKSENKTLVQQIGMYARQCNQLKRELYDVKENVLVEQKELVKKLRGQLREQEGKQIFFHRAFYTFYYSIAIKHILFIPVHQKTLKQWSY